ncbi:MAG: SURF1 family cytochrome oxidase biogenesis protein [Hyphomicrobiaceae bacterium]|nr:SURF1 family cytochrome oxidase biogenesis protein [Hyphomicrobiaceae bacterium]
MTQASPTRGLLVPTLAALAALAVLVSLGTWQLQRKAWKDDIVARIAARAGEAPVRLADGVAAWARDGAAAEYLRVTFTGVPLTGFDRLYYAPDQKLGPGHHVYTPFRLTEEAVGAGEAVRIVWVDRGFLPDAVVTREPAAAKLPATPVEVVGRLRAPGIKGTFSPDNDVTGNRWYWRDLGAMHASAFAEGPAALALFIEAESLSPGPGPDGWPRAARAAPQIANRHLEYAVTWFGLALTLIGVSAAFIWQRLSRGEARE